MGSEDDGEGCARNLSAANKFSSSVHVSEGLQQDAATTWLWLRERFGCGWRRTGLHGDPWRGGATSPSEGL